MIVYLAKKYEFLEDVDSNRIEERIHTEFQRAHRRSVGPSELAAWKNSMGFMGRILSDTAIPNDAGVAIEFGVAQSAKRIDFVVTGKNAKAQQTAVIIELKQWSTVKETCKDAIVRTILGGAEVETYHPSYQAWSYAQLITDFNETVRDNGIALEPCAYLHNCASGDVVNGPRYAEHTARAPAFLQSDAAKLRAFIRQHVRHGDAGQVMYLIRDGKIRPSKNLADCLSSLMQGKREFLLIDDQKLVFETALDLARSATEKAKRVLIVEGGPGTGKSVVAINLLVEATNRGMLVQYVTKNSAPRSVFEYKLTGTLTKSRISNLFKGSGAHTETVPNTFDCLVVDEAHRLNEKSGMYGNLGENQVKEMINSAKCSVFFIDEAQRVTWKDIGSISEIEKWAHRAGATVERLSLQSQFRCNGSDGYPAWVDNTLQRKETAHVTLEAVDYEFEVCDSASALRSKILEKNLISNRARMVAGYCWDWKSKKSKSQNDIVFHDENFSARWNLSADGSLWIVKPETVTEVGCIHTCQGLELDYVGVILGPDLVVRNGLVQTNGSQRSKMDASIKGYKKLLQTDPETAKYRADEIIKNTYRTLMTRGMRGCFVYSVDSETNAYLKSAARRSTPTPQQRFEKYPGLQLRLLPPSEAKPFINCVPLYDIQVAAGGFSPAQSGEQHDWVELPEGINPRQDLFVTRVVGESMNRRIRNGSWCLFRRAPTGSRSGKVVLVELLDRQDPETGGRYTVKIYKSEKRAIEDSWRHAKITLLPDSTRPGFTNIELQPDDTEPLRVVAEFVAVL
ncbi:MAG TPA: DNA/RNA helicase domain-containing protein [Lacunisphaera sp.]